jgi:hypothetical protein
VIDLRAWARRYNRDEAGVSFERYLSGTETFAEAAMRALETLLDEQDPDGHGEDESETPRGLVDTLRQALRDGRDMEAVVKEQLALIDNAAAAAEEPPPPPPTPIFNGAKRR